MLTYDEGAEKNIVNVQKLQISFPGKKLTFVFTVTTRVEMRERERESASGLDVPWRFIYPIPAHFTRS
jgi:hypothetical protein